MGAVASHPARVLPHSDQAILSIVKAPLDDERFLFLPMHYHVINGPRHAGDLPLHYTTYSSPHYTTVDGDQSQTDKAAGLMRLFASDHHGMKQWAPTTGPAEAFVRQLGRESFLGRRAPIHEAPSPYRGRCVAIIVLIVVSRQRSGTRCVPSKRREEKGRANHVWMVSESTRTHTHH